MTKKAVQVAFLSLDFVKKGAHPKISFVTAESYERGRGQFSKEIVALSRRSPSLFSILAKEKTLTKEVAIPKIRHSERVKLAETLLCSGGLFEKNSLAFAFYDGGGKTHLFCARRPEIYEFLETCRGESSCPTGLTMPCIALLNFASYICRLEEGSILHLGDDEGLFVQIEKGNISSVHTFSFDSGSKESLAAGLRTFLSHGKVDVIWTTGPGALDPGLTNYLQAALGFAFQRPRLEQARASSQLCHTFALALGCAIEGSKRPQDQIDFRTGRLASRRLRLRGWIQEGLVAVHVAALIVATYFAASVLIGNSPVPDENSLKQDIKVLQEKAGRLPHALKHRRAGEEIAALDPDAKGFSYRYD